MLNELYEEMKDVTDMNGVAKMNEGGLTTDVLRFIKSHGLTNMDVRKLWEQFGRNGFGMVNAMINNPHFVEGGVEPQEAAEPEPPPPQTKDDDAPAHADHELAQNEPAEREEVKPEQPARPETPRRGKSK
jgi:hypothetical protein